MVFWGPKMGPWGAMLLSGKLFLRFWPLVSHHIAMKPPKNRFFPRGFSTRVVISWSPTLPRAIPRARSKQAPDSAELSLTGPFCWAGGYMAWGSVGLHDGQGLRAIIRVISTRFFKGRWVGR